MANSEVSDLSKVGVVILGTPGLLRNPNLQSVHQNVRFSPPVYLPLDNRPGIKTLFREFALNGRFLTTGERGCSQAHINLRADIQSSPQVWTLVLEDDVGIPPDWYRKVCNFLPGFPDVATPGVILLNTNPHFNLGPGLVKLNLLPSGANAFLIHKGALHGRRFVGIEYLERADWPISFSNVKFWSISGIAFEVPTESRIGSRKIRRGAFLLSTFIRVVLSPVFSIILKLPFGTFIDWSVLGPVKRDFALRLGHWKKRLFGRRLLSL